MKNPVWVVKKVQANPDYTLLLTFEDGERKLYNARPLLQKELYKDLRRPDFFMRAKVSCGTVEWDENIDIAPEYLYDHSVRI